MLRWTERDQLDPAWADGLFGPGALFELVEADVLGHRLEVFAQRPRSVPEILMRASASHGARPFLIEGRGGDGADVVTFADAPRRVEAIAAVLARRHGVQPGDRVVLAGDVSIDHVLTVWAVAALGAVAVTVNPHATAAELADAVELTRPTLIVSGSAFGELAAAGRDEPLEHPPSTAAAIGEDEPFAIVFTSGTTGRPKGATLSHRNAVHFSLAAAATSAVHSIVHGLPVSSGSGPCVIGSAPLFHVSGLLGQLTNGAFWGMTIVVPPPGRWDATTHLELSERHRVTSWSLVPTQLWRLIDHPRLADYDLSALEMVGGGGATFEPELLRLTAERLPHVAPSLRVGYGMTETSGTLTLLQPPVAPERLASVGTAVAATEVEIRDADGRAVPDDTIGEIWARGAQVFLGYWDDVEATDAVLDERRWYATGDFGRIHDGDLYLESRLRDLIIRGGENIYPIEIENRLVEHPAIAEAAVVGMAHPQLGQEVKAVCVRRDGHEVTAEDVREWVAQRLSRHKVPTIVEFRTELPRTDTGKVRKNDLID